MTYTIHGHNLVSRIIVNFANEIGFDFNGQGTPVAEAEVIDATPVGDFLDAYVRPLSGGLPVHVAVNPTQEYLLIG